MPGIDSCSVEPTAPSYLRLTAWIAIRPGGENTAMISYTMDATDHVYYSHDPGHALGATYGCLGSVPVV